jgi:hypothetical protein
VRSEILPTAHFAYMFPAGVLEDLEIIFPIATVSQEIEPIDIVPGLSLLKIIESGETKGSEMKPFPRHPGQPSFFLFVLPGSEQFEFTDRLYLHGVSPIGAPNNFR